MAPHLPRPVLFALSVGLLVAIGAVSTVALTRSADPVPPPSPTPTPATPPASPTPSPVPTPSPSPTPDALVCPLTGLPLAAELPSDRVALTVQIDNDPHARPQTGLSSADMIVEATVQGNVTRFGAVFYCDDPPAAVGPIRSARYYNLDLWQQVGALTVGFGGAPYTIQHFLDGGMPYLNGIDGWGYFFRSFERIAPYNVYSELEGIHEDLAAGFLEGFTAGVGEPRPPFEVQPDAELPAGREVTQIDIATNDFWRYGFTYRPDDAGYSRDDDGQLMIDAATDEPVVVRTLVIQRVPQDEIFGIDFGAGGNPILHDLTGTGTGTVYVAGRAFDVEWSRPDLDAVTTWTHEGTNDAMVLPPGRIWWQILPHSAAVTER
jgi:Protein of unknown function (DUF3048) N-terminal domain/Protein of unknown function (DUF3048) C-terminal domain